MNNAKQIALIVAGLILSVVAAWFVATNLPALSITLSPTPAPIVCPDRSWYSFESGAMGWEPQTQDSQAVREVKQSTAQARLGIRSLELLVELDATDAKKSSGEAFVDLRTDPPSNLTAPVNLQGMPISIWVLASEEAAGDRKAPNGVQVFVSDRNFNNEYGPWVNLTTETGRWIPVTLTPSRDEPPSGKMQPGFDPTQVVLVGIKIGAADGSTDTYTGPLWIDDVCW
jgi:hypothetical protein